MLLAKISKASPSTWRCIFPSGSGSGFTASLEAGSVSTEGLYCYLTANSYNSKHKELQLSAMSTKPSKECIKIVFLSRFVLARIPSFWRYLDPAGFVCCVKSSFDLKNPRGLSEHVILNYIFY